MQLHTLQATMRTTGRKGMNTQARVNGSIPSVIYGGGQGSLSVTVDRKLLDKVLHTEGGAHALMQLEFNDESANNTPAIIKAVQRHPVSDAVLHVDFMRIRLDQRIQSPVAVVLTGRAKGVLDGGVVDQQLREVIVECMALDIPRNIEIDISNLGLGEGLHVSDLQVAEGVTILTDPELAVAAIHAPRVLKAGAEEAAAAEGEEKEAPESAEK